MNRILPWFENVFKCGCLTPSTKRDSRVSTAERIEEKYRRGVSIKFLLQIFQKEIRPPAYSSSQVTPKFWISKSELLTPLYLLMVVRDGDTVF